MVEPLAAELLDSLRAQVAQVQIAFELGMVHDQIRGVVAARLDEVNARAGAVVRYELP